MGAVGGAGATTLAIEMAAALSERGEDRVCLIDLNLADGAAPAYLGAPAAMSLADFGNAAERIDAALLAAFASPVSPRLDLLASPRSPRGFEQISREAVLKVLDIASETYGTVVIDLPRHRQAWTLDIVSGADAVVVISELTVPALISARDLCQELEADCPPGLKVHLVLNRLATRLFGPAPSMAEAERAVGRRADGGITSDWESAAASVNLGGPIRQHRPRSRIVRDVEALLARLNLGQAGFRSAA
jgi:pilus assembly protein CpaE